MAETKAKVPSNTLLRIALDPKPWTAFATVIIAWVAVFSVNVSPDKRAELIQAAIYATAGLVSAVSIASGYQIGKSLEGTVPEGYESAAKAPTVIVSPSARPPAPLETGQTETTTRTVTNGGTIVKAIALLLCSIIALGAAGCVGTSEVFKRSAAPGVKLLASNTQAYHDKVTFADGVAQAAEQRRIDRLRASVQDVGKIALSEVAGAWNDVAPAYRSYVNSDDALPTPEDKAIRLETANQLDTLIARERERQAALIPFAQAKQ